MGDLWATVAWVASSTPRRVDLRSLAFGVVKNMKSVPYLGWALCKSLRCSSCGSVESKKFVNAK